MFLLLAIQILTDILTFELVSILWLLFVLQSVIVIEFDVTW